MEEILKTIAQNTQRDVFDYISIFTPLLISLIALLISLWNSFWAKEIKKIDANLVWDDLQNAFYIIIRNSGSKTLVINSITLKVNNFQNKELFTLGTRQNIWTINQTTPFIKENEAIILQPKIRSLYDVFGYLGHNLPDNKNTYDFPVIISVIDIDNKKWEFETCFTLKEIDQKLNFGKTIYV